MWLPKSRKTSRRALSNGYLSSVFDPNNFNLQISRSLTPGSTWNNADEILDTLYWGRQVGNLFLVEKEHFPDILGLLRPPSRNLQCYWILGYYFVPSSVLPGDQNILDSDSKGSLSLLSWTLCFQAWRWRPRRHVGSKSRRIYGRLCCFYGHLDCCSYCSYNLIFSTVLLFIS